MPSSRRPTSASSSLCTGSTLVKPAVMRPSASTVVSRAISPIAVSNTKGPLPFASARATAVAIVACPQNGTSVPGEK